MEFLSGRCDQPFIMLHGGAGPMDPTAEGLRRATESLKRIVKDSLEKTENHKDLSLAASLLRGLEDDTGFNAGHGSALQADGQARLSASIMDGSRQRFSGVMSISNIRHPSLLAIELQKKASRVLTDPGHTLLARRLNLPHEDLTTQPRFDSWLKKRRDAFFDCDTVGVVVSRGDRTLVAGTSTGGRGFEEPGRVSDSSTVAGNYASAFAAVSLTGIGEEIVDDAVAARIETRVRDGMSLEQACRKCFDEAISAKRSYGWIACDAKGNWCVAYTTAVMSFVVSGIDGIFIASSGQ